MKGKLLFFILTFVSSCDNNNEDRIIKRYIPLLTGLSLSEVRIKKSASDPSYLKPYNVYLRFKASNATIDSLRLKFQIHMTNLDTNYLKVVFPSKEYQTYFSMQSINEIRDQNLRNTSEWWKGLSNAKNKDIYIAPYFDDNKIGQLILDTRKADGRIAFCITEEYCYILIESWG